MSFVFVFNMFFEIKIFDCYSTLWTLNKFVIMMGPLVRPQIINEEQLVAYVAFCANTLADEILLTVTSFSKIY